MPALKLSSIGGHNERVLLQFFCSANTKEITVKSVFEHFNWDYQNSKGEKLTRKKVQNRLDYLRKLGTENRAKFLEMCLQNGLKVDCSAEGSGGQHSSIGDQNEKVLLQHLRSTDKDKTLKWIFDRINWEYQNSKGELVTRKKVQNRLDYLRKLEKDKREQFLEMCLQNGLKVDRAAEGSGGQHSSIGDQNEKVLLQHLRSTDKDKTLKWIFDRINWEYQNSKGELVTRKKVQNRLDYLRSLEKDKREQFLEMCLQNGLKVDRAAEGSGGQFSDVDEEDYQEEQEEEKAPPAPTLKRDLATLTVENPSKRAKTVHYEVGVQLDVPQETPVYEFQPGQIVYGKKVLILPATNELPGNRPRFVINALRRWSSHNKEADKTVVIMT